MVGVNGFMSTRIAASEGHKNSIKVHERYLSWVQGQTVNFDRPKSERQAMAAEVKDATQKLAETVAKVPDAQAASLAEMFGTTTEGVQRTLVTISSGMAQAIKFACMFFGVLAWPNRKAETFSKVESTTGGGKQTGKHSSSGEIVDFPLTGKVSKTSHFPSNENVRESKENVAHFPSRENVNAQENVESAPLSLPPSKTSEEWKTKAKSMTCKFSNGTFSAKRSSGKLSREEALADLRKTMAQSGDVPSQRTLSNRWKVSEGTVSKWCRHWESSGKVSRRKSGKCQEVQPAQFASLHEAGTA
jgi:hypothetical protein